MTILLIQLLILVLAWQVSSILRKSFTPPTLEERALLKLFFIEMMDLMKSGLYIHSPALQSYPDGNPTRVSTMNFAYDDGHILYREIDKDGNATDDRCIDRNKENGWNYVPAWFGYGVYDENGDMYSGGALVVNYTGLIQTSGQTFTGTVQINSGTNIGIPLVCKKVKDGTHYNANDICSHSGTTANPITIAGEVLKTFLCLIYQMVLYLPMELTNIMLDNYVPELSIQKHLYPNVHL